MSLTSHELARRLLLEPDFDVLVQVNESGCPATSVKLARNDGVTSVVITYQEEQVMFMPEAVTYQMVDTRRVTPSQIAEVASIGGNAIAALGFENGVRWAEALHNVGR